MFGDIKMLTTGLDIGSRTIALVEWDGKVIIRQEVVFTGQSPLANSKKLLAGHRYDRLVATGYGRHLAAENNLADEVITEIRAYAIGAHHLFPDVRTILDIGGQDSKVISVRPDGGVARFEMNDRCAAGTGRFLENMATALDLKVEEIGPHAMAANGKAIQISSMCTVFAESETVSLLGKGEKSEQIALGIHQAIVKRVGAMVRRIGFQPRLMFAGGVAQNPCMKLLLETELGIPVTVPGNPQTVGALGAAILAAKTTKQDMP
jgi:(R)-2-hydroxyacyl-CoA dehydratese activating ATPase